MKNLKQKPSPKPFNPDVPLWLPNPSPDPMTVEGLRHLWYLHLQGTPHTGEIEEEYLDELKDIQKEMGMSDLDMLTFLGKFNRKVEEGTPWKSHKEYWGT